MKNKTAKVVSLPKVNTAIIMADLKKQAKPLFTKLAKVEAIKTAAEFDLAGQQLKLLKGLNNTAKDSRDGMVKPMRDGVNQTIAKIDEHFKPFFEEVTKIETSIKLMMSVYLEESKKKKSKLDEVFENSNMKISTYAKKTSELSVTSTKGGAQVRKVWKSRIVDESKIPRALMVPDMVAIETILREGKKVPGVIWEQVEKIAI